MSQASNWAIGAFTGAGIILLGGGALVAYRMATKKPEEPAKPPPAAVPSAPEPSLYIVGRPYPDPFYSHYSHGDVWGSGPWTHRVPRMRPIAPPHFFRRRP